MRWSMEKKKAKGIGFFEKYQAVWVMRVWRSVSLSGYGRIYSRIFGPV